MDSCLGLGTDIIEIERIRMALKRHGRRFMEHILTMRELEQASRYKDSAPHLAGRFAAKEAIVKALGTGISAAVSWHDIEVIASPEGKPEVFLSERIEKRRAHCQFLLSISHAKEYAVATALYIRKDSL